MGNWWLPTGSYSSKHVAVCNLSTSSSWMPAHTQRGLGHGGSSTQLRLHFAVTNLSFSA